MCHLKKKKTTGNWGSAQISNSARTWIGTEPRTLKNGAKIFLGCSPASRYIFLYPDIFGVLFLSQLDLEKCSLRMCNNIGILNYKSSLLFSSLNLHLFSGLTWIHGYPTAPFLPTSSEERGTFLYPSLYVHVPLDLLFITSLLCQ